MYSPHDGTFCGLEFVDKIHLGAEVHAVLFICFLLFLNMQFSGYRKGQVGSVQSTLDTEKGETAPLAAHSLL